MTPNIRVEVYDPNVDTGVKHVPHVCGSFTVDSGALLLYTDSNNQRPTALYASGEWRCVTWL